MVINDHHKKSYCDTLQTFDLYANLVLVRSFIISSNIIKKALPYQKLLVSISAGFSTIWNTFEEMKMNKDSLSRYRSPSLRRQCTRRGQHRVQHARGPSSLGGFDERTVSTRAPLTGTYHFLALLGPSSGKGTG